MRKQVKIKITSRQTYTDGEVFEDNCEKTEQDPIVISNTGLMEYDGGKYVLSYEETELTGMPNTVTCIEFDESKRDCLVMNRHGQINTTMYFALGERYVTPYDTGVIPIQITLSTVALENNIDWTGGKARIEYDIELHGMCAEHTVLDIHVT